MSYKTQFQIPHNFLTFSFEKNRRKKNTKTQKHKFFLFFKISKF